MCVIAIDYDDTITKDFNAAKEAIQKLKDKGHIIIIWSTRNNPRQHGDLKYTMMRQMIDTLKKYDIPYNEIDWGHTGKYHAQVYIDDKAIRFENNWNEIINRIY